MIEIIFATKNKNKTKEINEIIADVLSKHTDKEQLFKVISMEDYGIDIDVIEDGETFVDNSIKKAVEIHKATNKIILSDDSGLEIDFLNKEPGVHSARFMGKDTPYEQKIIRL